jgi:hypothetical protein
MLLTMVLKWCQTLSSWPPTCISPSETSGQAKLGGPVKKPIVRGAAFAFALLFAAGLAVFFAPAASADQIGSYNLTNVTFVGGGSATGSFTFDFSTDAFTALNINTLGTIGTPAQSFTLANFSVDAFGYTTGLTTGPLNYSEFGISNGTDFLWLDLFLPPGTGGSDALVPDSLDLNIASDLGYGCRKKNGCLHVDGVRTGSLTAMRVTPEPASGLLMLTAALGLILFSGLRRKNLLA